MPKKQRLIILLILGVSAALAALFFLPDHQEAKKTDAAAPAVVIPTVAPVILPADGTRIVNPPDIYEIIVDAYPSPTGLEEFYGFRNEKFLACLAQSGFIVNHDARANYALTYLSLASFLNLRYMDELAILDTTEASRQDTPRTYPYIDQPALAPFLKDKGYQIIGIVSAMGPAKKISAADITIVPGGERGNDLAIDPLQAKENLAESLPLRERTIASFALLGELDDTYPAPFYAICHIAPPHPPYLFMADGSVPPYATDSIINHRKNWTNKEAFLEQLTYVNNQLEEMLKKILSTSRGRRAIIIIHGDHGSATTRNAGELSDVYVRERSAVLLAVRAPQAAPAKIKQIDSLVNLHRVILNEYFSTQLPLLPYRYTAANYQRPFKMVEMTQEAQTPYPGEQ